MNVKRLVILLACSVGGGLWGRPTTDVLVMVNGDRFTCEIKKLERGVLYVGFDYVDGTVSIQWSKVARVESRQLFLVHTEDGSVYQGTLRTAETPEKQPVTIEVLELTQNAQSLEQMRIVEIAQTSQSFWRRLSGNIESGSIYTKANNTTQYNIGANAYFKRELWNAQANFSSALSSSTGGAISTRNQTRLGVRRLIGERKWFYTGAAEFLQSSQQGIHLQTTLGGGIGRLLKDTNRAHIAASAGLAYQETQYSEPVGTQSPPNALAGLIGVDMHLFKFKKTSLDVTASVLPVLTQIGRVRNYVNTSYSIQIISNLWWKFTFYGNWDNRPPGNFSGSDYGASSGISWSFN